MYKLSASYQHKGDVKGVKFVADGIAADGRDGLLMLDRPRASSELYDAGSYLNAVAADSDRIYAGGQDATIVAIDTTSGEQQFFLGHENNVCALDAAYGLLASGSWDKTARVWADPSSVLVLKGHTEAVWAVKLLSDSQVLTASADKTIILWQDGKPVRTFKGHTDAVRGLCIIDSTTFASCSNDMTVKVWSLDGSLLHTLDGHTSFVYAVAYHKGTLFSSGEDRSVRLWRDYKPTQVITLPAVSLWALDVNTNGDIAIGASDSKVWVFSLHKDRWAPESERQALEKQLADSKLGEDQAEIDESKLKDPSVLDSPGKEGQVVMVRQGSGVYAHQYSGGHWMKIGEVVGKQDKKSTFEGKEYDYVFDVDIGDGVEPLKLPYNKSDNTYVVAEEFIERNGLPTSYVTEIVNFLIKNTSSAAAAASAPATSSSAPAAPSAPATSQGSGDSASASGGSRGNVTLNYNKPILMTTFQKEPMAKAFVASGGSPIDGLLASLPSSGGELLSVSLETLPKVPVDKALPVYDALRLGIAYANQVPAVAVVIKLLEVLEPESPKLALLATRGLANLAGRADGHSIVSTQRQVFDQALSMIQNFSVLPGPFTVAAATLFLNLAVRDFTGDLSGPCVWLSRQATDKEAAYRLALAMGVRAHRVPSERLGLLGAKSFLETKGEERFNALAKEVLPLLKAPTI